MARGVNVIAHLVAKRIVEGRTRAQLRLERRRDRRTCCRWWTRRAARGRDCVLIGQVHRQMPFMTGPCDIDAGALRLARR